MYFKSEFEQLKEHFTALTGVTYEQLPDLLEAKTFSKFRLNNSIDNVRAGELASTLAFKLIFEARQELQHAKTLSMLSILTQISGQLPIYTLGYRLKQSGRFGQRKLLKFLESSEGLSILPFQDLLLLKQCLPILSELYTSSKAVSRKVPLLYPNPLLYQLTGNLLALPKSEQKHLHAEIEQLRLSIYELRGRNKNKASLDNLNQLLFVAQLALKLIEGSATQLSEAEIATKIIVLLTNGQKINYNLKDLYKLPLTVIDTALRKNPVNGWASLPLSILLSAGIIITQLTDYISTRVGLKHGIEESNKLMHWYLDSQGLTSFLWMKLLAGVFLSWYFWRRPIASMVVILIFGFITFSNITVIAIITELGM